MLPLTSDPVGRSGRRQQGRILMGRSRPSIAISDDLRALLDASPDAVLAADAQGRIVYANARTAAVFGVAATSIVGQMVEALLPQHLAGRHVRHREDFSARPSARSMGIGLDLAGRHADGHTFPVEISLAPLATADGPVVFATVVDITARKSLETQLLQAQKMESVGRLAGGIAHDFNNMLFAIRSYAEMLSEDVAALEASSAAPTGLQPGLDGIIRASDQATALTSQLLAFSRQQVVQNEVRDVAELVRHVEPMLRRLIGERVRLSVVLDPSTGRASVDALQFDQMLMNLVVNARDSMPSGGTITVESSNVVFDEPYAMEHFEVAAGPYVVVAVSDTGVGMDRETRQHVFEPFFTTKEMGKGTGLGLSTVFGIVRAWSGHIWIYSEPGIGSTFKIYIPQVEAESTSPMPVVGSSPAAHRGTILLVEDDQAVRDAVRMVLQRASYTVLAPQDPREAVGMIEGDTVGFDVLLTDIVMPGLSGRDLAERAMDSHPGVGVVLLSGYTAETTDLSSLIERGARYASKPLPSRDLLALVESVLQTEAGPAHGE